jgi:deoxyribonuclease IV
MKRIGPHVHTTGGVQVAPVNAKTIGATAFGLFTKNQKRWVANPLEKGTIDEFKKNMESCGYDPGHVLAHNGYLINIGHPEEASRRQSLNALIDELERCDQLGIPNLNIHPGSHLRIISEIECLNAISSCINTALDKTRNVTVVVETTAGQGSNVGYRFEHIAHIIDKVEDKKRIGFCFDTCHIFAAGYDIRSKETYNKTMHDIDTIIGFKYLRGIHLNDSKSAFSSRVDRHHSIGQGLLGMETFSLIMNDDRFEEIPMILETIDDLLWEKEIRLLYSFVPSKKTKKH